MPPGLSRCLVTELVLSVSITKFHLEKKTTKDPQQSQFFSGPVGLQIKIHSHGQLLRKGTIST
jgi:hypothetical protein